MTEEEGLDWLNTYRSLTFEEMEILNNILVAKAEGFMRGQEPDVAQRLDILKAYANNGKQDVHGQLRCSL